MNVNFWAMKKLYLFIVLFVLSTSLNSQSFDGKGDKKLNVGYDIYGYGEGIKATFDYGIHDMFSLGFGGSYYFDSDSEYYLFGRTAFHFGKIMDYDSCFDLYPGVEIGYLERGDVGFTAFIGARYFFSENFGVYAELGNNGSAGISFAF